MPSKDPATASELCILHEGNTLKLLYPQGVPPVIALSIMMLPFQMQDTFSPEKVVAALRNEFGHAVEKNE
jgi:6-phosphogluconate dehydrogenase (decarboxylating)